MFWSEKKPALRIHMSEHSYSYSVQTGIPIHVQSKGNASMRKENFLDMREFTKVSVPIHVQSAGNVSLRNLHLWHTRRFT
ncbi:hypothetical protein AB205_0202420 [Aquarana catesbeiana]|uniref:Uncharacterized protein n=1 Tax=Aquarana catesbeiana TaxID=8400 RepID=A0A2G9QC24_AQUCT|nr:hypothetical protein AB205_0202420 [Aquarana catesbeiana]